jgi:hypothetical protein
MKIVFPGPDGQLITVTDHRRPPKPGKQNVVSLPVDRRPTSFMLSQFQA